MDFPGAVVIIILVYLGIFLSGRKKAKEAEEKRRQDAARQADTSRYAARPASTASRPAAARPGTPSQSTAARYNPTARSSAPARASAVFDESHYHREGYDFATCFSFKDVPPGADELTALIRANSRHEREQEKLMHTSDRN